MAWTRDLQLSLFFVQEKKEKKSEERRTLSDVINYTQTCHPNHNFLTLYDFLRVLKKRTSIL